MSFETQTLAQAKNYVKKPKAGSAMRPLYQEPTERPKKRARAAAAEESTQAGQGKIFLVL
jgi:hypothetical protein